MTSSWSIRKDDWALLSVSVSYTRFVRAGPLPSLCRSFGSDEAITLLGNQFHFDDRSKSSSNPSASPGPRTGPSHTRPIPAGTLASRYTGIPSGGTRHLSFLVPPCSKQQNRFVTLPRDGGTHSTTGAVTEFTGPSCHGITRVETFHRFDSWRSHPPVPTRREVIDHAVSANLRSRPGHPPPPRVSRERCRTDWRKRQPLSSDGCADSGVYSITGCQCQIVAAQ